MSIFPPDGTDWRLEDVSNVTTVSTDWKSEDVSIVTTEATDW